MAKRKKGKVAKPQKKQQENERRIEWLVILQTAALVGYLIVELITLIRNW